MNAWNSVIPQTDFNCCCQVCFETMEEPRENDPIVLIDKCGCVFRKSCLEGGAIRNALSTNVHNFFDGKSYSFSDFVCPNSPFIADRDFTQSDVITNTRYLKIWGEAQGDGSKTLEELAGHENTLHAFAPENLAEVYGRIIEEQRETNWEGKKWSTFIKEYREMEQEIRRGNLSEDDATFKRWTETKNEQIGIWDTQIKGILTDERYPAYEPESWGIFTSLIFGMRVIYHVSMAVIFEYGLFIANLMGYEDRDYRDERTKNVGRRIAELLLQWKGMKYDYSRPLTVENRLWNWISGRQPED